MHVPLHHRLSFTQARNTILIVFLLGLITTGYQIWADLSRHRLETSSMVQQVLRMQEESAALATWTLDETAASRVVNGLFHYSPLLEASITSDTGAILAHRKRSSNESPKYQWLADILIDMTEYSSKLFVREQKEFTGTLSIRIDNLLIAEAFLDRTANTILSTAIPLLILSFVLVLMFYWSLTKPLFHLSARLAAIDTEQPMKSPLEVPAGHGNDELGMVVTVTNTLLHQFEQLLARHATALQELRTAEKKYRSIFDNAIEGIFQTSLDGRFLSANAALAQAIGYESPEELMRKVTDIGKQLYVDETGRTAILDRLMQDGYILNVETQFFRKDGSILWASQSARLIRDEDGTPLHIEGTITDITATKQAMADMARLEAQLRQAQKMEALGNLTGGISHDFNNLLQIISGYVQLLLLKKEQRDPDYKYLYEVSRAASRAADLIKRMLTFSRKVEVRMAPLNLNEVILEAVRLLERTVPKMVSIRTVLAPDLAIVPADPTQMEQVIMNLASNAVQAMEENGTLTIETGNFPVREKFVNTSLDLDRGDYVLIKVTDTGCGMDAVTRQHIFEPFFTTKGPGQGTGLGLASVYGIVTGHSGKITCYSEPGVGTTFKIFLPVAPDTREKTGPAEKSAATLTGGTETILLVDDEETILSIAGDSLQRYGYSIRIARSGEEAIALYSADAQAVDLVIMDLGMAGMGGRKCLEELLKINPEVKVVIASGYGSYDIITDPRKFGARAFLAKPYRLDMLVTTVRKILDHR